MHPEPTRGQGIGEGSRQALSQDSHHMGRNKHATQETSSFGQAGRSVFQLLVSRHTRSQKNSLENTWIGITELLKERWKHLLQEMGLGSFCLRLNWTDKTEQTTSIESAYGVHSCRESSTENRNRLFTEQNGKYTVTHANYSSEGVVFTISPCTPSASHVGVIKAPVWGLQQGKGSKPSRWVLCLSSDP